MSTTRTRVDDEPAVQMPSPQVTERTANSTSGWPLLALVVVLIVLGVALIAVGGNGSGARIALVPIGVVATVVGVLIAPGLTAVAPGEARVVQLLGSYRGTVREQGFRWVNPFTKRHKVSTRIRNLETETSKVNDADGNPIEMAAVVVWQVADTARAVFEVDDFTAFVAIQSETAVRHIAGSYPYDSHSDGALSLRDNATEITGKLTEEIAARVSAAGVRVVESRITRLSYAPEIAQVMLQRQQAGAVVAARQRIVEGAVGMVESALEKLAEHDVVELDEERKATMVSNLLVVLCGDRGTQPVVNTGSLYQ
ncbi:SPFH domain-containing protein [Actinocatenispora comari]|jgi:regulator of protease activity HflC (stomatin/prohibitin superfamily)|uniref:Membrane protein n=1 Tax=Actinocatenispora comari TaxID=2807577 RepID=A0A8J4AES6_9ACTN|nr:SPFH domain-containing protein [Actinocatenispora comari]GIL28295.1 membrane protein [Actinocatenispora comari]